MLPSIEAQGRRLILHLDISIQFELLTGVDSSNFDELSSGFKLGSDNCIRF